MPAIGDSIGSYQILKQLGTGAMGEVYLAEHRHLKRKAAVKLLAPELVGRPDLLERFFLEARATSAIAHPGIVQVFDCEADATGRPYIVMEYLEGQTLAALLAQRGALPGATAARLGRGMAEALQAAHAKGIIHRDLKPENIFVQAQPPDTVKLVDFGIAKLAGDFRAGQVHQTRSGALMGTPLYMSPEQCRDSANIDSRTDLYSLGCVLFEMLTGRPPFTHATLGDLMVAHMTEAPPEVRALNPSVPPPLADLTADLLKKNPAERPAGMQAVADRLMVFLGSLTTVPESPARASTAPPAVAPAAAKTTFGDAAAEVVGEAGAPRRRGALTAALAIAVAGGLAVGGVLARRSRAPGQATDAVGAPAAPVVAVAPAKPAEPPPAPPPVAPAAPAPAAARPVSVEKKPAAKHEASTKKASAHHATQVASAGESSADLLKALSPSSAAAATAPSDFAGTWEGPWMDPEHRQHGRLYLQIGDHGEANGWFSNGNAQQSYRLAGRAEAPGELTLACQCPANQGFTVHAALRAGSGDLRGRLSLSSTSGGVFGQSHVVLRRSAAH